MNIANILGLYLGCKVRFEGTNGVVNARIEKVDSFEKIIVTDGSFQYYVDFKDCKLLLTPLSKITEDDEKELASRCDIKYFENIDELGLCYVDERKEEYEDFNFREIFWLASKGYDIGLVPEEYKEITE